MIFTIQPITSSPWSFIVLVFFSRTFVFGFKPEHLPSMSLQNIHSVPKSKFSCGIVSPRFTAVCSSALSLVKESVITPFRCLTIHITFHKFHVYSDITVKVLVDAIIVKDSAWYVVVVL